MAGLSRSQYAEQEKKTIGLGVGIYTIPNDPELIPETASQDSEGWISTDGQIELCRGRLLIGSRETGNGYVKGEGFGVRQDGTQVHFRKVNTKIQYYNTSTLLWTDIVTGLTASAEYTFSPYQSVAGTFVYATGLDGIFKIHTANPGDYCAMYDSTKNFKGKSIIVNSRMTMWDLVNTKTAHRGSYIDVQNTAVYTTVTGEATTSLTGRLAAKGGTFTVTIASPGVFTKTAHGFSAGDSVIFSTTGALPTGITAGTQYWVISAGLTADDFRVSATKSGSAINTSGSQSGTHTVVASMRTVFGIVITLTGTGEVYTENYNGTLSGSLGGTGTINYTTGVYTLSNAGVGTAAYSWEMTNNHGVTDFTFDSTRTAGQGYVFYQDEGGDAIQRIEYRDGVFYSFKTNSVYSLSIDTTDLIATNKVFRKNIGLPFWRALVSTSKGIIFMDTSNLEKPQLTILQPNLQGDNLEPVTLANHFDFSDYTWDACSMETFGEFVVFSGRTINSATNDKLFLYNVRRNTIDILPYRAKTIVQNTGHLYIGDTQSDNVYEIFSGFDDDGNTVENYWISNDKKYNTENLKKVKRLIVKGLISEDQTLEVYVSYDNRGYELIGTILGDGSYVDSGSSVSIGENGIGSISIGGGSSISTIPGGFFLAQLKISSPKFRKRSIKFKATGIGYVAINMIDDRKIEVFEQKLPKQYRTKQNVSLDGTQTDQ